jgi:hypothetical protein
VVIVVVVWMVRLREVREVTVVQLLLLIIPVPVPVGVGAVGDCVVVVVVVETEWVVWFVEERTAERGTGCVWCVLCAVEAEVDAGVDPRDVMLHFPAACPRPCCPLEWEWDAAGHSHLGRHRGMHRDRRTDLRGTNTVTVTDADASGCTGSPDVQAPFTLTEQPISHRRSSPGA